MPFAAAFAPGRGGSGNAAGAADGGEGFASLQRGRRWGGPSSPPASEQAGNPGDVSALAQKRRALCRSEHWCSQRRRGGQPLRSTAASVCRKMLGLGFPPSAHLPRLSFSPPVQRWVEAGEARGSVGVTAALELAPRLDMGVPSGG